MLALPCIYRLL